MKFGAALTCATVFSALVAAAPTFNLADVAPRLEEYDFELAVRQLEELGSRYASGSEVSELHKRATSDLISSMLQNLGSSNLLGEFTSQLSNSSLGGEVSKQVLGAIQNGNINATTVYNAISGSGLVQKFYSSVLDNPSLKTAAISYAQKISSSGSLDQDSTSNSKRAIGESVTTLSKRDSNIITSIITAISNSGIVGEVINSIFNNPQLIDAAENLIVSTVKSVNWSLVFLSIYNSGIVQNLFNAAVSSLKGKRDFMEEVAKRDLLSDLTGSATATYSYQDPTTTVAGGSGSGASAAAAVPVADTTTATTAPTTTAGLLDGLLGDSEGTAAATTTTAAASTSTGGLLDTIFDELFGDSSSSSSSSPSTTSSTPISFDSIIEELLNFGEEELSSLLSNSNFWNSLFSIAGSIFEDLFGGSSGFSLTSLIDDLFGGSSSSSSSSSTSSLGSISLSLVFDEIIDSLFGTSSSSTSTSSSGKKCCCSAKSKKKRSQKRAMKKLLKRSIKRSLVKRAAMEKAESSLVKRAASERAEKQLNGAYA